ncbi:SRPBCC domain-containing protein [Sphingopyxis alaskensis]|jgi:uncharacterized protein YndB with AHSA1/START domain|uniref:SRPBCC domain-containing protein n=1 Tax=Sphingopyxis alaskensis (strain DSM 13593 / LMG 18877 / RB2256) TaxID=317655 RepID=Q1GPY0_SPHAL|nr:SRPBCC domain-containing protein [Sphingopyxis alaskensis]ABF54292.1 hypothetical protein Sala_2586 [Sphingopyxis alaskensis RB2256]
MSMFLEENDTILHAAPPKVWAALTRFDAYERWNPFVRISGPLEQGALVAYSFRMKSNKPRFFTIDARITALEPQRCVTFRFGFGGLMSFEESYCVEPVPVGSRMVHSFRCTGLLSGLKLRRMRQNFSKMLEITDRLFQRHLTPARPPLPKKRPRKGFRPNA